MSAHAADLALVLLLVGAAAFFLVSLFLGQKKSAPSCGKPAEERPPQVVLGTRLSRALDAAKKDAASKQRP